MSQSRKPASKLPFEEQLAYAKQLSEQALREQQAQAQREYLFFQKTLRLSIDEAKQAKKQYENEILNTMYAQKASWEDEQQRIAKLAPKAIKTKTFFSRRDEPTSKALQKDEIYNHAVFNSYPL
jgi:hypothetical protein